MYRQLVEMSIFCDQIYPYIITHRKHLHNIVYLIFLVKYLNALSRLGIVIIKHPKKLLHHIMQLHMLHDVMLVHKKWYTDIT